jgi:hypothetical protein
MDPRRPQPAPGSWQGFLNTVRLHANRVIFQIDEAQEQRMRAYLDETYGDKRRANSGEQPIQMDALRCAAARACESLRACRPLAACRRGRGR